MLSPTIKNSWKVSSTSGGGTGSDVVVNVNAGANQVLYLLMVSRNTGASPTWSDVKIQSTLSMTRLNRQEVADGSVYLVIELWQYINPPEGSYAVHPQSMQAGNGQVHYVLLVENARQAAPEVITAATAIDQAVTPALSITPLADGALIITGVAINLDLTITPINGDALLDSQAINAVAKQGVNYFTQPVAAPHDVGAVFSGNFGRCAVMAFAVLPVAANSVTVTDKAAGTVIQRSGTKADVAISGVYTGLDPVRVQACVAAYSGGAEVVAWTDLSSLTLDATAKTFRGTLNNVPQGGWYTGNVRTLDSGGAVINTSANGVNPWGVGKVIAVIGSSTPAHWFSDGPYDTPNSLLRMFNGAWAPCTGTAAVAFGNSILANDPNIPIGMLDYGVPGSNLKNEWDNTSSVGAWLPFIAGLTAAGGGVEAVYCHVGSNDARGDDITSQADHEQRYRNLLANVRSVVGDPNLPIFLSGCQRAPLEPSASDKYWSWARAAELNVGEDANNHLSVVVEDLTIGTDNVHITVADMAILGRRVARSVRAVMGGEVLNYRGPRPISAVVTSPTTIVVTFAVPGGTGVIGRTSTTDVMGFRVSDDAFVTAKDLVAEIISPNEVLLTVATGVTAGLSQVDYLTGATPNIRNCIFDNATPA